MRPLCMKSNVLICLIPKVRNKGMLLYQTCAWKNNWKKHYHQELIVNNVKKFIVWINISCLTVLLLSVLYPDASDKFLILKCRIVCHICLAKHKILKSSFFHSSNKMVISLAWRRNIWRIFHTKLSTYMYL